MLREVASGVVYIREVVLAIRQREGKGKIAGKPQSPSQTTRVTKALKVSASAKNPKSE